MRTTTFAKKPVKDMRRVPTVSARLTDDDGILNSIYSCKTVTYKQPREVILDIPLYATCVFRSSASRLASGTMLKVIKQTEQRGSARLQLGQALG